MLPVRSVARASSIVELLKHRAQRKPDQVAYTFLENGEQECAGITYRQLDERARGIAAALQSLAQIGDRALLLYPPGLEFICGFMGCLYAGVIAVPAFPPKQNRSLQRLQAIVADAGAFLALTADAMLPSLTERISSQPEMGRLTVMATDGMANTCVEPWIEPRIDGETLAFLQYTSGSTGDPKGVMVSHGNLLCNSEMIRMSFGHDESTTFAGWLPLFHDMGLIGNVLQPLYLGIRSILMEPAAFIQKPARWLQAISDYRISTSGAPNSAYELCIRKVTTEQKASLDLSSWRLAFNGSEPIRAETIERFAAAFVDCGFRPEAMYPCYGLAEATLFVTGGTPGQRPQLDVFDGHELVSCGRTSIDQQVLIVDPETFENCPDEAIGEIWISGQNVAGGYWNSREATQRTFCAHTADGGGPFLRTGDLGFLKSSNLYVAGRIKDILIIGGRNHYPQDIERTLEESHPAIGCNASAAFSMEVESEERVAVVCEIRREYLRNLDVDKVVVSIRQALAEEHELELHAVALLKTSSIPRTSSGKIQRSQCQRALLAGVGLEIVGEWRLPSTEFAAPTQAPASEDIRAWLIGRVASKLGIDARQVDAGEAFTRYGMDSKDAVTISGELAERLGKPVSATLLYDFPNIECLARHLAGSPGDLTSKASLTPSGSAVAIVGLGCRFPGADNPEAFWRLLCDGVDAVTPTLPLRWTTRPANDVPVWGGLLTAIDGFDADFFGISDREAEMMDPQQRLLLEVVWEALENAGQPPRALAGSRSGVFVGISHADYVRLQSNQLSETDPYAATGSALSVAANRLSYFLDLRGPSWAVDTACSSSLVAVHQACQSLVRGECDLAISAGVNLILSPQLSVVFSRAGMLAADGRCKTFDAAADGYVRGEGAGAVVLKRLTDAVREGARVLAVIRGSAVSQDGRSNGLTAPNGPAQQTVIRSALREAGVQPAEIGYVEAHGTGTPLGDVIEMDSLKAVLQEGRGSDAVCWVGSVKTNLGHLEAAAGVCGLIKTTLALYNGEIPPHLHFKTLNPRISLDASALRIPAERQPWPTNGRRLAGVSSFGFGGTNAHVAMEAGRTTARDPSPERPAHLLALSAKTPAALRALLQRWANFLDTHSEVSLPDVAFTANAGRSHFGCRVAVVAGTIAELRKKLATAPAPSDGLRAPRVGFLFTGQGSQYAGMGRALYQTQPSFRRTLERCDEVLRPHLEKPLLEVLYASQEGESPLDETAFTQPALFALEYALAELWQSWGIAPAAVMGHSIGEYVAACVAGIFTFEDGLRLVAERSRLMQALPGNGSMMSVFAPEGVVRRALEAFSGRVSMAAINGPRHVVVSGECTALDRIAESLQKRGVGWSRLSVSHAFHSPLMQPMVDDFARVAQSIEYRAPRIDIVSNLSGSRNGNAMSRPEYWVRHILSPVLFRDGMAALSQMDLDVFLEIGPKPTLIALGRECAENRGQHWLPSLVPGKDDWTTTLESLASLYTLGAAVDWRGFDRDYSRRITSAPTYPFQRQRHWLPETTSATTHQSGHPLLGQRLPEMAHAAGTHVWETRLDGEALTFLKGHRVMGSAVLPYSAYVEMALAAARETSEDRAYRIVNLELHRPVFLSETAAHALQIVLGPQLSGNFSFRVYLRAGESKAAGSEWILCASARIQGTGEGRNREIRTDVLCQQ